MITQAPRLNSLEGKIIATPPWDDSEETQQNTIPTMKPGMTAFLITGDSARNKVQTMPGGGYASVKIELPKDWDKLIMPSQIQAMYNIEKEQKPKS